MRILGPSLSLLRRGWARGLDLRSLANTALGRNDETARPSATHPPPAPPEPPAKPPREK